jgi:sec-independent protein translocase protein TatB
MGNLGTAEVLVIFIVALIVLGPDKLPGAARQAGKVFQQMKSMSNNFQAEMRSAMKDPLNSTEKTDIEASRSEVADKLQVAKSEPATPVEPQSETPSVDVSKQDPPTVSDEA